MDQFKRRIPDLRSVFAGFDDGQLVSTSYSLPFEITLPGLRAEPLAWIAAVTTLPSHRGRGAAGSVLATQLASLKTDGYVFAALGTDSQGFYRKLGFGPSGSNFQLRLGRDRALNGNSMFEGTIAFNELFDIDELAAFHEQYRKRLTGEISRDLRVWQKIQADHPCSIELRSRSGEVEAFACYSFTETTAHAATMTVWEIFATTTAARRELWRTIVNFDVADEVVVRAISGDDPIRLMLATPGRAGWTRVENPWLRILDVQRALIARTYARSATLTLAVQDPTLNENTGCYRLAIDDGGRAECERVEDSAQSDLTLDASTLSSAYFGEHTFDSLAAAGLVAETTSGSLAEMNSAFVTSGHAPFCSLYEV